MLDTGTGIECAKRWLLPTAERGRWIVLRTHSRQERILASALQARNLGHFLPLTSVKRLYCDQPFVVEISLFPGYVFFRGRPEDVSCTDCAGRIREVIEVADQARLDAQLNALAQVLAFNARLEQHPFLQSAVPVKVHSGPLAGIEAVVADRARLNPLVFQVEALGQAVSVRVESAMVEPLN